MTSRKKVQPPGAEKRIRLSDDLIWGVHPVLEALQREPGAWWRSSFTGKTQRQD